MSASDEIKPRWLIDMQAWLRARPVCRAAIWAALSWALVLAFDAVFGNGITPRHAEVSAIGFAAGAVAFYFVMRWWEATHAG